MSQSFLAAALIGLAASGGAILLSGAGILDGWENVTWTWRVRRLARPGPATERIRLILIDQKSLAWASRENGLSWPWPREVYAPILDFCRRGGARAIAFDMLYTEPSAYGPGDDDAFTAAAARTGVFVAAAFFGETGTATAWPPAAPPVRPTIAGAEAWQDAPGAARVRAAFPIDGLLRVATAVGSVSADPDPDGVTRRARLFHFFDSRAVPALSLATFVAGGEAPSGIWRATEGRLEAGALSIPLDGAGRVVLNYRGPTGTYRSFSAAAVIQSALRLEAGQEPPLAPEVFRDCYVILAPSAPGLMDLKPTPLDPVAPGGEIHATALDNLLAGDFLRETPAAWAHAGTLFFSVAAALLMARARGAIQSAALVAAAVPLPTAVGFLAYARGLWLPVASPTLGAAGALLGVVILNYAVEGRRRRFLKNAFAHYLSPEVIERIVADPGRLRLGGERRELSIFFSDLQGFSSFSERLDPVDLTALLNDYLSEMTDIILEEGGTLDKYEGDAIIAFWNAPLAQEDHALRACRAAVRCQRRLAARRPAWRARVGADLRMRIGLNTGPVVVGNMGSRSRFNYTILGDAANLASRLEGANKAFATSVMASAATWRAAGGEKTLLGRLIGSVQVVGRKTPVDVYEVAGLAGEPVPASWADVARGIEMCHAGRAVEALPFFASHPDDPVAAVYAERCRWVEISKTAWDGIWNLTEK